MIEHLPATTSSHVSPVVPALIAAAGEHASLRFLEFFVANRDDATDALNYIDCILLPHGFGYPGRGHWRR